MRATANGAGERTARTAAQVGPAPPNTALPERFTIRDICGPFRIRDYLTVPGVRPRLPIRADPAKAAPGASGPHSQSELADDLIRSMPQARLRFEIAPDLNHQADMAPKLDPPMVLTSEPQHDKD